MPKLPFKIGADPEFTFVSNNIRYSAHELISKFCKGKKEFVADDKILGYVIDEAGTLGWDGHDSSGEIRPKENSDPREVTKNIGILLQEAYKCMPTAEIKTTSLWMSIGGHIHLEAKDYLKRNQKTQKILQRALASLALPLLANENPINVEIRREQGAGYGDILDARVNGVTYEFRPLTAEWITTPEICNATLAYLGVIWNELYNHPERIEEFAEIIAKTDQQIRALQEITIDEYGALTEGLINRIKKHVRKFELYEEFKTECEFIFDIKKIKEIKEKIDFNIVKGWKFKEINEKTQMPSIKEIVNQKTTQEKLKNINMDDVMNYIQIFWTQERNMEKVARKIGDTVIAWKWNLSNRYFLMSLPKGIPSIVMMNGKKEFLTGTEMIKTQADHQKLKQLMFGSLEGFQERNEFQRTSINLKNGKAETDEQKSIIIGIPYQTREEDIGIENILKLIHKNETKKLSHSMLDHVKDMDLPTQHPEFGEGLIVTAIIKANEEKHTTPTEYEANNIVTAQRAGANRIVENTQTLNQEELTQAEITAMEEELEIFGIEEIATATQPLF